MILNNQLDLILIVSLLIYNVKYKIVINKYKKPTHTTMIKLLIKQGLYEFNSNKSRRNHIYSKIRWLLVNLVLNLLMF